MLRQKVRAAAAVRGGGHTAHTSVSDPHDGVGARAGTGTAGRGVTSGAPGVSGSVPSTGGAAATTTTGNSHRVNTHTNNTTNNTADPQIDDEERAVLCFAVDDDDDVTNNNAPRTVAGVNSGQIGPELRKLRQAQGEHAEYYTLEHYDRLYGRRVKWDRNSRGSKTWCKDVHGPGCTECTSCHFCRQKTSDVKTRCQCGEWRKQPPGGRGRGAWCGWCLEMRVGENIVEALGDDEWRCPVCRDICNCSGANCQRCVSRVSQILALCLVPRVECNYASLTTTKRATEYKTVCPLCVSRPSRDTRLTFSFPTKERNATCSRRSNSRTKRSSSGGNPWRTTSSRRGSRNTPRAPRLPFYSCRGRSGNSSCGGETKSAVAEVPTAVGFPKPLVSDARDERRRTCGGNELRCCGKRWRDGCGTR